MPKYRITFSGRNKGAIGVFHFIETEVEAADIPSAVLALYDRFDHVHGPKIRLLDEHGKPGPNAYNAEGRPFAGVKLTDI